MENRNHLCIATISWARNEDEETLLRRALQQLATFNLPVFITDGGSGHSFLEFIRTLPNFHLLQPTRGGVCAQVKHSLLAAYNNSFLLFYIQSPTRKLSFKKIYILS